MSFRAALLLFGFFFATGVAAQNGVTGHPAWQIKPAISPGFILVHRISIGHLVKGYPTLYELNISKPTLGNKLWQLQNNLPDLGLSLQFLDYKNPSQLGYAYTIAPYLEIPFREADKKARMVMRISWGLSYLTKKFDIEYNHKNIAIGSHFNAFAQFKWFWQIQLNDRLRFEPGVSFTHASNGKYRNPNLGLNVAGINAALNILIPGRTTAAIARVDSTARFKKRNEILFVAAAGVNERFTNTRLQNTFLLSFAYQRNVGNVNKLSAGFDLFYDENYLTDYLVEHQQKLNGMNQWRVGARIGYSYNVGRVSFPFEMGYYVFQRRNPDGLFVSRLGVRYYARNGLVGHFGLRTHFAIAYNLEFGIGYRIYL